MSKRDAFLLEQRRRSSLANAACASAAAPATAGSTILRQTRGVGARRRIARRGSRPTASARPSRRCALALASARADQALQAADRLRPVQRVEVVLDAQHRRRVDRLALEDALDQLAALGQAEDLRQRPGRRVALQPRHRARATGSACRARPRRPAPSARRR